MQGGIRMARPRKTGLDYFPHDVDASEDEKIEALRALHGNDGYAFYFILLERIYRSENAELDISKKAILAALIKKVGVVEQKFFEMLETCFEVGLLDKEAYEQKRVLTSNGIKKRFEEVQAMRERWRKKKQKSKDEKEQESSLIFSGENSEETGESKVKQSKEKKSKVNTKENKINVADDIYNQQLQQLHEIFANNIHPPTPIEAQKLTDWLNYVEAEIVVLAIEEAVKANKRTLNYVEAILKNWEKQGLKTKEDVEAYLRDWQDGKNNKTLKDVAPKNYFNSYSQRKYDVDELERRLLEASMKKESG